MSSVWWEQDFDEISNMEDPALMWAVILNEGDEQKDDPLLFARGLKPDDVV